MTEAELTKRITAVYSQAAKEMLTKVDSFLKDYDRLNEKKKQLLEEGKIAEAEYVRWAKNKLLMAENYKSLQKELAERLNHANEISAGYINGELPSLYTEAFNKVGTNAESKVKGFTFNIVNEQTIRELSEKDENLLPFIEINGKKDVRWNEQKISNTVLQGILQGDGRKGISKRLMNVCGMNKTSAMRNAQTAYTSAANKGQYDSMVKLEGEGIVMKKRWYAAIDSHTRDAHAELHRVEQDVDKPFHNSIGDIMYPGDPNADPSNVYNCRCTIASVVIGVKGKDGKVTMLDVLG